jgi:dynein heavy chain
VHVSMFRVDSKDIIKKLSTIYTNVQKQLVELIAKRAKTQTNVIYEKYNEIQNDLRKNPPDIESLVKLKEMIANELPDNLEKLQEETQEALQLFDKLEGINHKMGNDDLNKKWQIYGGPKMVYDTVASRQKELDRMKGRFFSEMNKEQEDFKEIIENLESTVNGFYQNTQESAHIEMNERVIQIMDKLDEAVGMARKFNSREDLFGRELNDYSKIQAMIKEFAPFNTLWKTTHGWHTGNTHWLNDKWESINAEEAEEFVDEGGKSLAQVLRVFKDRDAMQFAPMIKIADKIKACIDEFKPKAPLLVALRKQGMKDRHWAEISEKVGFEINPDIEGFNFQMILDKG